MPEEVKEPKYKFIAEGADTLSLGISIVVAVLIGVALGLGLKKLFEIDWLLWVGVFIGIAAAILNVYKAYSKQYKAFEKMAEEDVKYNYQKYLDDEDEDEKY